MALSDMITNKIAVSIRSAGMDPEREANLVSLIEAYGKEKWQAGYDEGIAVANGDWP